MKIETVKCPQGAHTATIRYVKITSAEPQPELNCIICGYTVYGDVNVGQWKIHGRPTEQVLQ